MPESSVIDEKVQQFFAPYRPKTYKKGEIIIQAGNNPAGVYLLEQGIVSTYTIMKNGTEAVVNLFKPRAFFPMSWAINHTANAFYYQAETTVVCRIAPAPHTVEFLQQNPDVLYDLVSRLYKGMDGLLLRMSYLLAGNKYASIIAELLIVAKRFGQPLPDSNGIQVVINQNDIATQSGMARETVSREMQQLKSKGLITFSNHTLVIHDVNLLEAELAQAG
jgi:CRP-like cAMP-binding protein